MDISGYGDSGDRHKYKAYDMLVQASHSSLRRLGMLLVTLMCARSYRPSPAFALSQETQLTRLTCVAFCFNISSFFVSCSTFARYTCASPARELACLSATSLVVGHLACLSSTTPTNTLSVHVSGLNAHAAIVTALVERR